MSLLLLINHWFAASIAVWQQAQEPLSVPARIWKILTTQFITSPLKVSPARLIIGITLLIVVLWLSGKLTNLLEGRISKQKHIDPGLRYTIARLIKYILLV